MTFPPTYDLVEDATFGDGVIFTDIHMDPNSIPAPAMAPVRAFNDNISDEEEEEEEFEEDPEEDPEQDMDETSGEPAGPLSEDEPVEAIPSFYARGGSETHVLRTAHRRVRFPSSDYASTSRAPHHSPTPSLTPSPTPGRVAPPTPSSPIGYTPSSEPSSPVHSSPFSLPYSPTTLYPIPPSPAAEPQPPSSPFPGNLPEASMPVRIPSPFNPTWTPEDWVTYLPSHPAPPPPNFSQWVGYWDSFRPTFGASTSTAPLPQPPIDPRVAQLMGRASNFHLRITQLEDSMEILPGPAQLEDISHEVQDMDERVNRVEHRAFELNDRVLARGALADRVQRMDSQLQALIVERVSLRSRVRDLEGRRRGRDRR